jgi:glycosyltransferase involved in cell wall biosynthesis
LEKIKCSPPLVAILLCTYNGASYIDEQLYSIKNQTFTNWKLFISDDGSNDATLTKLKKFKDFYGEGHITIFKGPAGGSTVNFLSLLKRVGKEFDFYAFCDQDDIWLNRKLETAITILHLDRDMSPALYCSSSRYISADGKFLQTSYVFKKKPSFKNALVQSIAGGNTMVFNRTAANILVKTPSDQQLVSHDWWSYIMISAHGGSVYYDKNPHIDYRQHSNALVGENRSFHAKIIRITKLLDGRFKQWNDENLRILYNFYSELSKENQLTLSYFHTMKYGTLWQRLIAFNRSGIRRQTIIGNVALIFGLIIRKV